VGKPEGKESVRSQVFWDITCGRQTRTFRQKRNGFVFRVTEFMTVTLLLTDKYFFIWPI